MPTHIGAQASLQECAIPFSGQFFIGTAEAETAWLSMAQTILAAEAAVANSSMNIRANIAASREIIGIKYR